MSKGSKARPTNQARFKENYDNIKWGRVKWTPPEKRVPKKVHYIMPDIDPYQAVGPEQGKVIGSRSTERVYLKDHNCIQVGNEKEHFFKYNGKTHSNPTREW